MKRPEDHESWCAERGYEECTCDLAERQERWDREHRAEKRTAHPDRVAAE